MMSANTFKAAQHVKNDERHRSMRASRFVSYLHSVRWGKISIDTMGPMDEEFGLEYIIVIVDCFTRYCTVLKSE